MDRDGLVVENNGNNNIVDIQEGATFTRSRIIINGDNNHIILKKTRVYSNLFINLKGNLKHFECERSSKNVNGLRFTSIRGKRQRFTVGKEFSCGGLEVQMNDGDESCCIGEQALFSWGIKIRTSDGHSVVDIKTNRATNLPQDVEIGSRVWVGEDVAFLKGTKIVDDCIVASMSVVTKKFNKSNCVIAGHPACVVKEGVRWDRRMPYEYNSEMQGAEDK